MAITASMVKELRERTGAGMMECKKALVETGGDLEADALRHVVEQADLEDVARRHDRRDGVLVHHLTDAVLEQDHELIEGFYLAL